MLNKFCQLPLYIHFTMCSVISPDAGIMVCRLVNNVLRQALCVDINTPDKGRAALCDVSVCFGKQRQVVFIPFGHILRQVGLKPDFAV